MNDQLKKRLLLNKLRKLGKEKEDIYLKSDDLLEQLKRIGGEQLEIEGKCLENRYAFPIIEKHKRNFYKYVFNERIIRSGTRYKKFNYFTILNSSLKEYRK